MFLDSLKELKEKCSETVSLKRRNSSIHSKKRNESPIVVGQQGNNWSTPISSKLPPSDGKMLLPTIPHNNSTADTSVQTRNSATADISFHVQDTSTGKISKLNTKQPMKCPGVDVLKSLKILIEHHARIRPCRGYITDQEKPPATFIKIQTVSQVVF